MTYDEPAQEEMAILRAAQTLYEDWADSRPGSFYPSWEHLYISEKDHWIMLTKNAIKAYETAFTS